ncbi:MAG: hypothetical protein JWQ38_1688 [Flavipsychrobacter sp.]|nr:hypothetical protein [Flavipsychrobacter sp.]
MATVRIVRSSEFMNRRRDYHLFVDGTKVGTVANGETKDFQVSEGQHTVYAKIDWCYSPEHTFTAGNAAVTTLNVSAFKYAQVYFTVTIIAVFIASAAHRAIGDVPAYTIYGLCILPMLLIYTAGRKKYLRLTEETTEDAYVPPARIGSH